MGGVGSWSLFSIHRTLLFCTCGCKGSWIAHCCILAALHRVRPSVFTVLQHLLFFCSFALHRILKYFAVLLQHSAFLCSFAMQFEGFCSCTESQVEVFCSFALHLHYVALHCSWTGSQFEVGSFPPFTVVRTLATNLCHSSAFSSTSRCCCMFNMYLIYNSRRVKQHVITAEPRQWLRRA